MDSPESVASSDRGRTFEVGPCLGAGGFGEVYHAIMDRPGGLRTEVALKVLHEGLSPKSQAVERLRDEGRLLGLLRHPAIVRVLDLVVLEGRVTLVSEYIEGVDLHRVRGELPVKAAVEVIGAVADALSVAWRQSGLDGQPLGLVHRDVKPANIRLGRHGEVKLLDFGIAKAQLEERDANTSTGMILGSLPYLSPERMAGKPVGPPGDIHALGSTLFEALVGRRLHAGLDVPDQVRMALDDEEYDEFIEEQLAELEAPEAVVSLLRDMLARDPEDRPTAHALSSRCDAVAASLDGPGLRRWARTWAWPGLTQQGGPLSGRTLTDGATSGATFAGPRPPLSPIDTMDVHEGALEPPKRRSVGLYVAAVAGVIVVLGLACLGIGGAVAAQQVLASGAAAGVSDPVVDGDGEVATPDAGGPDEGEGPVDEAADEAAAEEAADLPTPAPDARPGTTRPAPAPTPTATQQVTKPTVVRPDPAPTPEAPAPAATGRIALAGAITPEIRHGARRVSPGEVAPGTYTLWYDFGEGLKQAGTIEVRAGQTVTVQCNRLRYDCSSR